MNNTATAALAILMMTSASLTTAIADDEFKSVEITTTKVTDNIYMLQGAGGNIGLSVGDDGAFVIDDQFAPLSKKIISAIKKASDEPVEFVINTHYHGDHTGGNEAMAKIGARIVAHDNARKRLKESLAEKSEDKEVAEAALPVITFSQSMTFHWNGNSVHIWHPENTHTDGDSIVFFKQENVLHMGDIFFNGAYPYIDLDAGGTLDGVIAVQEAILAKMDGDVKIIPGHGALATPEDLQTTIDTLKDIKKKVQALIDDNLDEDAAVAADPLKDLNEKWGQGFINGERMVRTVYKSLTSEE